MIVNLDGRLSDLVDADAPIEQLASGFRFLEGPVWNSREQCLLFCDWQEHKIQRGSEKDGLSLFRDKSNSATGLTYDPAGRLIAAERRASHGTDGGRRVSRIHPDGRIEAIATHYNGGRLSSPNDLICLANGDVVFTDPDGGLEHADGSKDPRETPFNGVYRISAADNSVHLVTGEIENPNGIVKRDDAPQLLIVDRGIIRSCDMETGALGVFSELVHGDIRGGADGLKLDSRGNLYVSGGKDGIWVLSPEGDVLGFINVGEQAINMAWGDEDWQTLYIAARTALYRVRMKVAGQQLNPR